MDESSFQKYVLFDRPTIFIYYTTKSKC